MALIGGAQRSGVSPTIDIMDGIQPVSSVFVIFVTANALAFGIAWGTEFRHRSIAIWCLNRWIDWR
jgi:hypothetical protein